MTATTTEQTTPDGGDAGDEPTPAAAASPLVRADLLVEDVSIDGMCGVY
jgi:mycofactocin precursor